MKILFVNSSEPDYMQDMLYSGLVKALGAENIYDFPFNPRFHFVDKRYPRNLGLNRGWHSLKRLCSSRPSELDLVVVGSCKPVCFAAYERLIPQLADSTPVVFVDGGDRIELGGDLNRLNSHVTLEQIEKARPFDFILKREFIEPYLEEERIIPFPFCMNLDRVPSDLIPGDKQYDVSFWAVESSKVRTEALGLLEDQFDCRENGTTTNQSFHKYSRKGTRYLRELSRCKVVLNFRGVGWDTLRYWEAPAVGAFMMTQKPGILIPDDFIPGVHVSHVDEDLGDLLERCRHYLDHPQEREAMARAASTHLRKHHTDRHRAQTLLDLIGSAPSATAKSD